MPPALDKSEYETPGARFAGTVCRNRYNGISASQQCIRNSRAYAESETYKS